MLCRTSSTLPVIGRLIRTPGSSPLLCGALLLGRSLSIGCALLVGLPAFTATLPLCRTGAPLLRRASVSLFDRAAPLGGSLTGSSSLLHSSSLLPCAQLLHRPLPALRRAGTRRRREPLRGNLLRAGRRPGRRSAAGALSPGGSAAIATLRGRKCRRPDKSNDRQQTSLPHSPSPCSTA